MDMTEVVGLFVYAGLAVAVIGSLVLVAVLTIELFRMLKSSL